MLAIIKSFSPTDALTEMLVTLIQSNGLLQEPLEISYSPEAAWVATIKAHFTQLQLNESQQKAFTNAFLFFSANPLVPMGSERTEQILLKISEYFSRHADSALHCFDEARFHELPFDCIHTLAREILGSEASSLEEASVYPSREEALIFYRFIELFVRIANDRVYTQHTVHQTISQSDFEDIGSTERFKCSLDLIRQPALIKLLALRDIVLRSRSFSDQLINNQIRISFTQVSLLLHLDVDEERAQDVSRSILKLTAEDIPEHSPLAHGNSKALMHKLKLLSPAKLAVKDEAPISSKAASEAMIFPDAFDITADREFETFLRSANLDMVIRSCEEGPSLPYRDIGKTKEYAFFLLVYFLEKKDNLEEIKQWSAEDKKALLNEFRECAREKNKAFQQLARLAISCRFTEPVGIFKNPPIEPDRKHAHVFSIASAPSVRESKKQAIDTLKAAKKVCDAVLSSHFVTETGVFQYAPDEISSCFSRWSMRIHDVQLSMVSISGRAEVPVSNGKPERVLAIETGGKFKKESFFKAHLSERTLMADYPLGIKPFLFVLSHSLKQLSGTPCFPEKAQTSLSKMFLSMGMDDVTQQLTPDAQTFFQEMPLSLLKTASFRGKEALLIEVGALDAHLQETVLHLCNLLNVMQDKLICFAINQLPKNENQLLSVLLRGEFTAQTVLANKDLDLTPTRSLCAELSIVPGMAFMTSLLGASPEGLFNTPVSKAKYDTPEGKKVSERFEVPMAGVEGNLWSPCPAYCDHRRELDKLLLEMAREPSMWIDFCETLYDGKLPNVFKDIVALQDKFGNKIGLSLLKQNQVFLGWAEKHTDPEIRDLFFNVDDAPEFSGKLQLPRTDSTASFVSSVCSVMDAESYWRQQILLRGAMHVAHDILWWPMALTSPTRSYKSSAFSSPKSTMSSPERQGKVGSPLSSVAGPLAHRGGFQLGSRSPFSSPLSSPERPVIKSSAKSPLKQTWGNLPFGPQPLTSKTLVTFNKQHSGSPFLTTRFDQLRMDAKSPAEVAEALLFKGAPDYKRAKPMNP